MASSVNVLVRARPLSQSEIDSGAEVILKMEKYKTFLNYTKGNKDDNVQKRESFLQKQFLFDRSFWSVHASDEHFSDQSQIFNEYGKKVIQSAIDGYNACVIAYGQTGSGKTFTMMGSSDNLGIIPRICEGLFKQLMKMRTDNITSRLEVSFMEIYNEHVHDLLQRKPKNLSPSTALKVREHPKDGPFVQDLSMHPVTDYPSIEALIDQGNSLRATAETKMNALSSRSHSIFTLRLTQAKFCGNIPSETVSKVHLVDLAGSERIAKSGVTGIRLKEGGNINKSLTTLGLVISALAENSNNAQKNTGKIPRRQAFVPYRDSVLTWLLKDSIGGNSKTIMIATVSPAHMQYGETLSTLRYAGRARKIVNKPIINEDPNVKTIRELRSEIDKLRKLMQENDFGNSKTREISCEKVEAKLKENEEKADELTKHWLNKITEAQRIFKEKAMSLSQQGHQTVLTSSNPHLVGLEVDPLSTDIVIYHLEEGRTVIGSCDLSDEQGIALEGSGIAQEHCNLTVSRQNVVLRSISGPTFINDQLVAQDRELRQGDVLQFGHFLKFRFHNPMEAAALREKRRSRLFSPPGRISPAVMLHYRSLDSGLSSPDDFYQDLDQVQDPEQVFNSTAASDDPLDQRNISDELQAPYREGVTDEIECQGFTLKDDNKQIKSEDLLRRRKLFLKSSSASEMLRKPLPVMPSSDLNRSFQLNATKNSEIYLSADSLVPRKHSKEDSKRYSEIFSSPNAKHSSSGSDLSLPTDDLTFNLMLQSEIKSSSPTTLLSGKCGRDRQSPPSLGSYTQSMWELSPRKYEQDSDMQHCESMSVLYRSSTGDEIHVQPDASGSSLAREAKDAADFLKNRRDQLKKLIKEYRSAEITRVEVEKENIRRAQDNEQVFAKQQSHLKDLIQQQQIQLNEAKNELKEYRTKVCSEKQRQRTTVELELDNLMNLKQEHLPYFEWSEHELRKKKFKLKVKIEDYWKRSDLYETLLIELQLKRNKVSRDNDEKLQEKMKQFEQQQTTEVNELREDICRRQHAVDMYKKQLEVEREKETELSNDIQSIDVDFTTKINDAEKSRSDVQAQEATMLSECRLEIEKLDNKIEKEKEKLFKYTIYRMHECDSPDCSSEYHEHEIEELDCKLTEEKQQLVLNELSLQKEELETEYDKKVEKYNSVLQNAVNAVTDLQEDHIITMETKKREIACTKELIQKLERILRSETGKLKNELKACERPRSFISGFPEETEEDMIANEQQIEQLLLSKEKVCKKLENSLADEFKELKEKHLVHKQTNNGGESSNSETIITAADHALSLVLHAGNSFAYAESLVSKHAQYENRKKTLLKINTELQDLMKCQTVLHRDVAENFLEQKKLFEEVRSQERKDIHDTIQTLITENSHDKDELLSRIFNESGRIIAYQNKLDALENRMYAKVTQNHELQGKLDEIQEKLAVKTIGKQNLVQRVKVETAQPAENENVLTEEFDVIRAEKKKCEQLISELQEKLFEERKEYLELLKCKDDYDVIGPEYRDERRTLFQTEGNKSAADVLREIFMVENVLDVLAKNPSSKDHTCGGWQRIGEQRDVQIFKKRTDKSGAVSVLGRGIIKASPKLVWDTVRNPLSRLIYDKMVKKINIVENFTEQLKVVYFQHHARLFLMKQKKDCCCVHNERIENNKYIATYRSVEHPDCPEKKSYTRLLVHPSGWVLEPYTRNGENWCLAWYVLQVDVGKGYLPAYFLESLVQKLPLSISSLREYLVLS